MPLVLVSISPVLEDELQGELRDARIVGVVPVLWRCTRYLPKRPVYGRVRIPKVRVVEHVEVLSPKLQVSPLVKRKLARNACIPIGVLRANQCTLDKRSYR